MKKQYIFILFLIYFFATITACENNDKKEIEVPKELDFYEVQTCDINDIFTSSTDCIRYIYEQFYIAGHANEKVMIARFNTQGQYLDKIVLSFTETAYFSIEDFFVKEDGSIACICKIWNFEEGANKDSYFYACFDQNGTECSNFKFSVSQSVSDSILKEDSIYLLTGQELLLFDKTGTLLEQYKIEKAKAFHLAINNNGTIYIICYTPSQDIIIKQIDPLEKKIGKEYSTGLSFSSINPNSCFICPMEETTKYELIAADGRSVYGLDKKGNTVRLFTWTNCNTFIMEGSSLDFIPFGKETYALLHNNGRDRNCLYLVSKQEKKQEPKTELVLYVYSMEVPDNIKLAVIGWNKQHPDCHITMESNTPNLHFDIVSGKQPDIFVTNDINDVKDLANKNYFMNCYDIMKEYPEGLQKEELFQPILQLYETEKGSLYSLPIGIQSFSLLAGGKTEIQGRKQWKLQDISDLMEQKPIGTRVMANIFDEKVLHPSPSWKKYNMNANQENFFLHLYSHSFYDFYDTIAGFHRDTFQNLLDFTERWCLNSQNISPEENPSLLWYCDIENSYKTLLILGELQKLFGKNGYDFIGYPCENGTGIGVREYLSFSITANGTDTKAAWDFVQSFCSQEAQTYRFGDKEQSFFIPMDIFPIRNSAIYPKLKQQIKESKIDTTVSTKEIKKLWNFITYADFLWDDENEVDTIVREEINTYYNGKKEQEEMLNILENRINLYINEKK